jgi:succinyl-diaminopimelate desuccinylase
MPEDVARPPGGRRRAEATALPGWILLDFFRSFIRCQSPNPPGNTREAAAHICQFLARRGAHCRVIAPNEIMPNIVATFEAGKPGRHLALYGNIDCFPVGDGGGWTHDPWGGELVDGRIYGRGACDMKCGTTAAIFTFLYLRELRAELHGRLTIVGCLGRRDFRALRSALPVRAPPGNIR